MYIVFRQVIPHINDLYKERVHSTCSNLVWQLFFIEFAIMVGSSLITLRKLEKVQKRETIYSKNYM